MGIYTKNLGCSFTIDVVKLELIMEQIYLNATLFILFSVAPQIVLL